MTPQCECVYNTTEHPRCNRLNANSLIALSPTVTANMCEWCAEDWHKRHPEMEILSVT